MTGRKGASVEEGERRKKGEAKRSFPGFDDVVNGPLYCSGTSSTSTTTSFSVLPLFFSLSAITVIMYHEYSTPEEKPTAIH